MKKILCFIDTLGVGGAERQIVGLSVLLKNKGYDVDLVYYYDDSFYVPMAQKGGVNPKKIDVGKSQWGKIRAIRRHIKQKGGYDCIIAYKAGPNVIGCILKLFGMNFRLIVSERIASPKKTRPVLERFFFYRWSDYVVPNSYSQRNFIEINFPNLINKTVVITNFTDTNYFTPFENDRNIIILTAARIARQKNVLNYLEAIAKIKDSCVNRVKFEWYGDVQKGEENYGVFVDNKVKDLGISDLITFHPNISNILERYQKSSIFCLPSSFEGYPNAICEAMSCGKPILCSRVCDNPNIVNDGENGFLFNPASVDDIAEKLTLLIKMSPENLEKMGKISRKLALERFSEEVFVNKYIDLIES